MLKGTVMGLIRTNNNEQLKELFDRMPPMEVCTIRGYAENFRFLNEQTSTLNWNPLLYAIYSCNLEAVRMLTSGKMK